LSALAKNIMILRSRRIFFSTPGCSTLMATVAPGTRGGRLSSVRGAIVRVRRAVGAGSSTCLSVR